MSVDIEAVLPKEYEAEVSVVAPQGSGAGGGVPRDEFDLLDKKVDDEIERAKKAEGELEKKIDEIDIPEVDLSDYYTKEEVDAELKEKQDAIADLGTIRSGAEKGATAVQKTELTTAINAEKTRAENAEKALSDRIDAIKIPEVDLSGYVKDDDLASVATSGSYKDLADKPTIPKEVTEKTVSGWGFTKNEGTYVKPNDGIPASDLSQEVQDALSNAGDIPVVEQTETTVEIAPNVLNLWGEVAMLDITLAEGKDGVINEYMFQFTSGATATKLSLSLDIKWLAAPSIQANKIYQVSIINNLGVIGEFGNE